MDNKQWKYDLDPNAVSREANANVRPRVALPQVGQSITVVFLSEPRLVPASLSGLGRDFFVADVDDGSGITKQVICSKSVRQHLAAMEARGDLRTVVGAKVMITARWLQNMQTRTGQFVDQAKVYDVVLLNPVQHGTVAREPIQSTVMVGVESDYGDCEIIDMGPLAE